MELREGQPRRDRRQVLPRHGRQLPARRRQTSGASTRCGSRAAATWRSSSETAAEPLTLEALSLRETRYPLELESRFTASDPELAPSSRCSCAGMQMCAHETYFDCPYFEQMQYVADARIEALCQYVMTRDDRLTRKALYLIDASRHAVGPDGVALPGAGAAVHPLVLARLDRRRARLRALARRRRLRARAAARRCAGCSRPSSPAAAATASCATPEGWNDSEGTRERTHERAHPLAARLDACAWRRSWRTASASPSRRHAGGGSRSSSRRAATRRSGARRSGLYADAPGGAESQRARAVPRAAERRAPAARRERVVGAAASRAERRSRPRSTPLTTCSRPLGCSAARNVVFDRLGFWVELPTSGPQDAGRERRADALRLPRLGLSPAVPLLRHAARHPARGLGLP